MLSVAGDPGGGGVPAFGVRVLKRSAPVKVNPNSAALRAKLVEVPDAAPVDAAAELLHGEIKTKSNPAENNQKKDAEGDPVKSIDAGIKGGALDSFSLNVPGIDLSEALPGQNLKLIFRETRLEFNAPGSDESIANKFLSGLPPSYNLGDYQQLNGFLPPKKDNISYSITGFNIGATLGGYSMTFVNYTRPPDRKSKIFYGLNTRGPYALNVSNILQGSEKIEVEGRTLTRDTDYGINYTKGEITFIGAVPSSERIIVEYEVLPSGTDPGVFTGFRVEKSNGEDAEKKEKPAAPQPPPKPAAAPGIPPPIGLSATPPVEVEEAAAVAAPEKKSKIKSLGFSMFRNKIFTYGVADATDTPSNFDSSLMGLDTKFDLGKHALGFEFARSQGDKNGKLGHYAKAYFTIADSKASDGNSRGPYNLDERNLPIVEESDVLRVNGTALQRDKDYSIDLDAGRITFINNNLNLTPIDEIMVEYRYLTEDDQKNYGKTSTSGAAWLFSLDSNFGKLKHSYSYKNYGTDFMLFGGRHVNTLYDYSQKIEYAPFNSLKVTLGRTGDSSLQDSATNLKNVNSGTTYGLNWKRRAFSFSMDAASDHTGGNQADGAERRAGKQNLGLSYTISKKVKFGFTSAADSTDETRFGSLLSARNHTLAYTVTAKPLKNMSLDLNRNRGRATREKDGASSSDTSMTQGLKLKYSPKSALMFSLDYARAAFRNAGAPDSGNRNTRAWMMYKPSDKWNLFVQKQNKFDLQAALWEKSGLDLYQFGIKPHKTLDVQVTLMRMNSEKPAMQLGVAQTSISSTYVPSAVSSLKIILKKDDSTTNVASQAGSIIVVSLVRTSAFTVGITCAPFWKDMPVGIEIREENTSDPGNPSQDYSGRGYKYSIETPFIGESSFELAYEANRKAGAQRNREGAFNATLKGAVSKRTSLSFSYRIRKYSDDIAPAAGTRDSNVLVSGEVKW